MGRPKKTDADGPVKIRFREMKGGKKSIYLDCYRDGKRSYEFLKLYILPGRDATTRAMNDNAMAAARTIQLERTLEIQNQGTQLKTISRKKMLLDDLMQLYEDDLKERGAVGGADNIRAPRKALRLYKGDKIELREVTKEYCERLHHLPPHLQDQDRQGYKRPHQRSVTSVCSVQSSTMQFAVTG